MRRMRLWMSVLLAGMLLSSPGHALTQRGINTLAASLLRTHRALIETPGLRQPAEALPAYFLRLLALQPGEVPAVRKARITGYLKLAAETVDSTASARQTPALHDTSAGNRALWRQASLNMTDLPGDLAKAQAAWKREETPSTPPKETAQALARLLWHIQNAYAALRDVRP